MPIEPNKQLDRIEASLSQIAESLLHIENAVYIAPSPQGFIESLSGHPHRPRRTAPSQPSRRASRAAWWWVQARCWTSTASTS